MSLYTEADYVTAAMLDDAPGTFGVTQAEAFLSRTDEDHYERDAYSVAESYSDDEPTATALTIEQYREQDMTRTERRNAARIAKARAARTALYPESSVYVETHDINGEPVFSYYALPNRLASFFTAYRTDDGALIGLVCKCGARLSWEAFDGDEREYALRVAQHTYRHTASGQRAFPHTAAFLAQREERHAKWEAANNERGAQRMGRLLDHGSTTDLPFHDRH
jgi:hypothetical protein